MLTFEYELCNYLNPIKNNKQWCFVLSMIKVYGVVQFIVGSILCILTVMYQAAKYAGIEVPCAFDSGGHVTFAMKLVELNLFVWILYCSWDHYIGDEDKKKNGKERVTEV